MAYKWFVALLMLVAIPAGISAQEPYLVAYAGFAGFQAPVWAPAYRTKAYAKPWKSSSSETPRSRWT